ncbi:serine/threonine-protein kinase, partial [Alkalimonas collagenimarina]
MTSKKSTDHNMTENADLIPAFEATSPTQQDENLQAEADNRTRLHSTASASLSSEQPTQLIQGTLLQKRYLIESLLGTGGISHIYRARDTFLEQAGIAEPYVAIKVLQKQFVNQPEALQLLLQEARKTQQLAHPNIIRLFDVSSEGDTYFLVMEYLDGETLEQVINRYKPKGLPLKSAMKLLEQIAAGLEYAHQQGIVHADLKPANIMLDSKGHVKLLDFGVAQKLQQNVDIYAAENLSQSTPVNGYTPAYASMELLKGEVPTPADDVYSFACLTYELLTSKHPFDRTPADKAQQEGKKAKKPAHLSPLQWIALRQALAFESNKRLTSVGQLTRRLERSTFPLLLGAIASVAALSGMLYVYQDNQATLHDLQSDLSTYQQKLDYQYSLLQLSPEDVLQELEKLTDQNPIIPSGLLTYHSTELLNYFEQSIDALFSERTERYPNYRAIERLTDQASQLYPDSHQLASVRNRVARSKQSSIEILQNQLTTLLLAQKYQNDGDRNNPFQVLADLRRIEPDFQPLPSEDAVEIFLDEFGQAMASHNAPRLQELVAIGQAVFYASEPAQPALEQGVQMQAAIDAMAAYQDAMEQGVNTEFPYTAAEVFYLHSFNEMSAQLEQSARASEVDAVYEQWQQFEDVLPNDFELSVRLRKQLADKYLALSGELLKTHQVRNAERLMRRANELMV